MSNNLFLVHTPYQLLNCLNIIENDFKDDSNDIVFLHENMEKYHKLINAYNRNINIYKYKKLYERHNFKNRFIIRLFLIFRLIQGESLIKDVKNKNRVYDAIFVPSENVECNIIYNYFYKKNNLLSLYVYDDGFGTYTPNFIEGRKNIIYRLLSVLIYGFFFWENVERLYCYQPELIDYQNNGVKKKKINSNSKIEDIFSRNVDNTILKKYKNSEIIYLDQGNIPYSYENSNIFFELCKKYFNENEILLKTHPRVKSKYDYNFIKKDNKGNTFEEIFFRLDIENKILVSMCSTGCLNPYILKNKYPYVIFLGFVNNQNYKQFFSTPYFKKVLNNYKSDRIFIPKTEKELENSIKFIYKKINND